MENEKQISDSEMFISSEYNELIDFDSLTKDETKYEAYVKELEILKRVKTRVVSITLKDSLQNCIGILNSVSNKFDGKLKVNLNITASSERFLSDVITKSCFVSSIKLSENSSLDSKIEQPMFEVVSTSTVYKIVKVKLLELLDENNVCQTSLKMTLQLVS